MRIRYTGADDVSVAGVGALVNGAEFDVDPDSPLAAGLLARADFEAAPEPEPEPVVPEPMPVATRTAEPTKPAASPPPTDPNPEE